MSIIIKNLLFLSVKLFIFIIAVLLNCFFIPGSTLAQTSHASNRTSLQNSIISQHQLSCVHLGRYLFIKSKAGKILLTRKFPTAITAVYTFKNKLYLATRKNGFFVFQFKDKNNKLQLDLIKINRRITNIKDIKLIDNNLHLIQENQKNFSLQLDSVIFSTSDNLPHKPLGKIIEVTKGKATLNTGKNSGLNLGDKIAIVNIRKKRIYDPFLDKEKNTTVKTAAGTVAISEISNKQAQFKIPFSMDVRPGDIFFLTNHIKSTVSTNHWNNLLVLKADFLPGIINLEDSEPLSGFLVFSLEYTFAEFFKFDLSLDNLLNSAGDVFSFSKATIGYSIEYFDFFTGIALGMASTDHKSQTGFYLINGVRLGKIDSWKFNLSIATGNKKDVYGFEFTFQIPWNPHFVYLNVKNYSLPQFNRVSVELGDRILIFGNGGPQTLFIKAFLGIALLTVPVLNEDPIDPKEEENRSGLFLGAGIEYRH
ncbi:MAG: hypothetical protein PF689_12100 [Deltaproteobacteria bacterium]|nr:hypothetical protein [Deltaproteobacteria bacterium]